MISSPESLALAYLGDGHVKVQVEAEDRSGQQDDEHRVGGVFEIGELNLHASELDPPTDGRIDGRGFEPHRLPICRLNVFKVIHRRLVVLVDSLAEDDERVSDKEVGDVFGQRIIDACRSKTRSYQTRMR